MLSQNYDIAGYQNKDSRERREYELPDTDISKSPFAEVYKYQSINGDYKEKTQVTHDYLSFSICGCVEVAIR